MTERLTLRDLEARAKLILDTHKPTPIYSPLDLTPYWPLIRTGLIKVIMNNCCMYVQSSAVGRKWAEHDFPNWRLRVNPTDPDSPTEPPIPTGRPGRGRPSK